MAVEIYAGVWFEIERDESSWRAIRVARPELGLVHAPEKDIDMTALEASGEPIPIGQQESRSSVASDDEPFTVTQRPRTPLERFDPELIGIPPEFDGDKANSDSFLTQFDILMDLNRNTQLARDPWMRSAYFLNIMTNEPRITVKLWVQRNTSWLLQVKGNPDLLPKGKNAWEVLEADFRYSFEDYCGREIAVLKLLKLQMKQGQLDDYIAEFEYLAVRARYGLNELPTAKLFASGLPRKLAEACIGDEFPESFDQWTTAVRHRYPVWKQQQAKNRMAITEDDKEKYLHEGRCFHCGEQGHIARYCPDRRSCN
jgi:hypothetical protein